MTIPAGTYTVGTVEPPSRQEWEIAARGPEGLLYPPGNTVAREHLTLARQTYSVDESSTIGYYHYSEEVYFIDSFGPYAASKSPFGLRHLVRPGREWNAGSVQRSLSDLGAMAVMIPGNRPRTWDSRGRLARQRWAFSSPSLVHYTDDPFWKEAALRVVVELQDSGQRHGIAHTYNGRGERRQPPAPRFRAVQRRTGQ